MTRDEYKARIAGILSDASKEDLCDVVVIGIRPGGQAPLVEWSGTTVASLVLQLEYAKARAVHEYAVQLAKRGEGER